MNLPISFLNGYQLESTAKFAEELQVRLIDSLGKFIDIITLTNMGPQTILKN